jgi:hypothetical protein
LTIGNTYQVEVWSADITQGAFITDLSGSNSVSLNPNIGQYAVGTFTATATTLQFNAQGDGTSTISMLNAISVRDITAAVPEPSTYALLFAGLLALGFVQSRRRKDQAL